VQNRLTSRGARRALVLAIASGTAVFTGAAPAAQGGARGAGASGTLQLAAALDLVSVRATPCPPGGPAHLLCPGRTGRGLVRGLGEVTETYSYLVEETPPSCGYAGARVLAYPVRWAVAGKGEIHFDVHEAPGCLGTDAFTADQAFTVTGGTGIYAGASGSGIADRALRQNALGATGRETWSGTLTVPGLEFDLTPPTIAGAAAKVVRAPRRAKTMRVRYRVAATDDVDGSVGISCRPASGSRFRVGRRTRVSCSATDTSANTARTSFSVTVRRR
jgi:hypothetical protein